MSQNETSKLVGRRVKSYREARGLTAEQVAEELSVALEKDVKPYIVNRMEKGDRPITVDEVVALERILGVRDIRRLFAPGDRESNIRVQIRSSHGDAYAAFRRTVRELADFIRLRDSLKGLIVYAQEDGIDLTQGELHDYSSYDAEGLWARAEIEMRADPEYSEDPRSHVKFWQRMFRVPAS